MTGIQRAVEAAGGTNAALGAALNPPVTSQAVSQWVKQGWVPVFRAIEMEQLYAISRRELLKPELVEVLASPDASGDDLI